MLSRDKIEKLFSDLNEALAEEGELGEVGIVGGAVMCLVYNARKSTKDVDAIFKPAALIRKLVARVAERERVHKDWLNDAAKGFIQEGFRKNDVLNFSHLRVWAPEPRYMLAMKCISARWDTSDKDDVRYLLTLLRLKDKKEVFKIIEGFYPKNRIPPKTQYLIEELFEKKVGASGSKQ